MIDTLVTMELKEQELDAQIARLTESSPHLIGIEWGKGEGFFKILEPADNQSARQRMKSEDVLLGCLTQIRREPGTYVSPWEDFTEQIGNDERLPKRVCDITLECLSAFKEWALKIHARRLQEAGSRSRKQKQEGSIDD